MKTSVSCLTVALLFTPLFAVTQDTAPDTSAAGASLQAVSPSTSVPRLVRFSGVAKDANGKPLIGTVGITFSLYRDQEGGAPLWLETQNVFPGSMGNYTVQLGVTLPEGLPTDIFASAEARWLGVQISGQTEQPRVLLLAVPYALKAVDAETIGGLPPSAFARASSEGSSASGNSAALGSTTVVNNRGSGAVSRDAAAVGQKAGPPTLSDVETSGTAGFLAKFISLNALGNSNVFQGGTNIGIGTQIPGSLLTVNGTTNWGQVEIVGPTNAEASMGFRPGNINKSNTGDWLIGTNTGAVPKGSFVIQNAFTADLTISRNGYVGIGTTTPAVPLQVAGSGGVVAEFDNPADTARLRLNGSGGNTGGDLIFQRKGTSLFGVYSVAQNTLGFYPGDGGLASVFINGSNVGIGTATPAYTLDVNGNVRITGNLIKGGGSFKIDDPLDPENKYLSHSFVESPDMMNVYNGNITTDKHGLATVVLPEYFQALNRDFRYQLTVIGQFAQATVQQEIRQNRFAIKTSKPSVKVSWQVTGIRHDAYADAYRIPVEEEKPPLEQGHYLHPELFGASEHQAIGGGMAVPSIALTPPTRASMTNILPEAGNPVK